MTGSFLDSFPGFVHWAATSDVWRNRGGVVWVVDLSCRTVRVDASGVVSIHPDDAGSTAWFADVLQGECVSPGGTS